MLSIEKYGNVQDDKKEAVVTTPFSEKKSLTTTKILKDMKEEVVTIRRKKSDKFEGQSKGYTVWLNLDSDLVFSTIKPDFY